MELIKVNSENFSQSPHIPGSYYLRKKEFLIQENSSIKEQSLKMSILVQFQTKLIFLKWKWKTGLNGSIKCPKFEKKFKRERTANFYFCPSNVSHNLGWKNQMKEKYLHFVTRIPLTILGQIQMNTLIISFWGNERRKNPNILHLS